MKKVQAYHVGNKIDLTRAQTFFDRPPIKRDPTFLLYEIDGSYNYIKDYGAVVFFNEDYKKQMEIIKLMDDDDNFTSLNEDFLINENSAIIGVDFTTISIPVLNVDFIHVIALNLAQSVALDHYQGMSYDLLESSRNLSDHLERTGKIGLNRVELAKFIGKTVNLKSKIADNLYIFDSPDLTWNEPELSDLEVKMKKQLEIRNRHQSIQYEINTVSESLELFRDMLQYKHSTLLEWIIIILILIEVVHIFI